MVLPNTNYNIDGTNCTLDFVDTDDTGYTIIVPIGNYNANTLRDAFNALFATTSPHCTKAPAGCSSVSTILNPLIADMGKYFSAAPPNM